MDKTQSIKSLLVSNYFAYLRKLNKGYPMTGYDHIKDSMLKLNYLSNYDLPKWQQDVILDSIQTKLRTQNT